MSAHLALGYLKWMNEMPDVIGKLARELATTIMLASVLVGLQAAQAGAADRGVGALAYAPQTETLFRSDGEALYRSDGDGKQWTKVPLVVPPDGGWIAAVATSMGGLDSLYLAGFGVGVLKSDDAGESWVPVDQGLPSRDVIAFATHSTLPGTLYAVLAEQGIYRSEDGGQHWRMVDKGPQAPIRRLIHSDLQGSMQTGWLFAATDKGIYRSMDCFCGWRSAGRAPHAFSAVAHDPVNPMTLYAAAGRQVFSTDNGGEAWQAAGSPGGEISALAHSPSGVLYALLADGRVVHSRDQARQWE